MALWPLVAGWRSQPRAWRRPLKRWSLLGLTQFEAVIGRVHGVRYSKAESIEGALQALRVPARDAVMVGDRMHDVIGAREWEIPCIGLYSGAAYPGELEEAGAVATGHFVKELAQLLGL